MKSLIVVFTTTAALAIALPGQNLFAQETPAAGAGTRTVSVGVGLPNGTGVAGYIGLAAVASPDYPGSDGQSANLMPLADIRQQGFFFLKGATANPNYGIATLGWNALNFGYTEGLEQRFMLSAGPMLRVHQGRDPDDALRGLGEIDDSVAIGAFLEASAGPWSAEFTYSPQDVGGAQDGELMTFSTDLTAQPNDRLDLTFGVSASWADDNFMQGFFGVTPAQAAATGLTAFSAGSGMKDVGIQIGATYEISDKIVLVGDVGYQRLLDEAADSPIVANTGSQNQFRVLIGAAYQFGRQ